MKKIASLADDERVPKKRRKGNGGGFSALRATASLVDPSSDDMFGADDADWAIYRKIVRWFRFIHASPSISPALVQNTTGQSSDEEEELQQLQAVEQKLLTHDPTFTIEDTHAYISTKRSALISAFKPVYNEGDPAGMEEQTTLFPGY